MENYKANNFPKFVSFMHGGHCYDMQDCPSHTSVGLCNVHILLNQEMFHSCAEFGYTVAVPNTSVITGKGFDKYSKEAPCASASMILLVI